jgi:AcrR family transcriptional regulator
MAARAQRADAQRNVAAILDAAQACLLQDPHATIAQIAQAAGVGRVTLYGHFATRADLVDSVFARVTEQANSILDPIDTSGEPVAALARLTAASWQVVHSFRGMLAAAESELPAERIRGHHDRHLDRLAELVARGQRAGAFRTDVPQQWLLSTAYGLMHTAAADCFEGRLDEQTARHAVVATILAAFTPPGATVPTY